MLGVFRFPVLSREFDAKTERMCIRIINHLSRHEGIEDLPVSVLANVLADKALRSRLYGNNLTENEEIEAIQNTLTQTLVQKELEISEQALQIHKLTEKVGDLNQEVGSLSLESAQAKQRELEAIENRKKIEEDKKRAKEELSTMKAQLKKTEQEKGRLQSFLRWSFGILVSVIGLSALFFLPKAAEWNWFIEHEHKTGLQIYSSLFIIGISWLIIDTNSTRRWIAFGSVILAAIIGLAQII